MGRLKNKKNKKGFRKFIVSLMLAGQFLTLAAPLTAYADDEDEDTETEEVKEETELEDGDGTVRLSNVFADGNARANQAYIEASGYDPYVHYVTTYNTLKSGLNDEPKNSPYAKVYRGDGGEKATSGSGSVITDKYEAKNTRAKTLLEDIEKLTSGDEASGDALQESPDKVDENEVAKQEEELAKKAAEEITDAVMPVIDKHLGLNISKNDLEYHRSARHGYNVTQGKLGGIGVKAERDGLGSSVIPIATVEKAFGSKVANVNKKGHDLYKGILQEEIETKLKSNNSVLRSSTTNDGASRWLTGIMTGHVGKKYDNNYTYKEGEAGIDASDTGFYLAPGITYEEVDEAIGDGLGVTTNNVWGGVKGSYKTFNEYHSKTFYMIKMKGYNTKVILSKVDEKEEEGRKKGRTDGIEFITTRYSWNYQNMPKDNIKKFEEEVASVIKNTVKTGSSSKLNKLQEENKLEIDEDVKIMSWTPIYPKLVASSSERTKISDQMEKADDRVTIESDHFMLGGKHRTLQGMDLFVDTEGGYSPVLLGTSTGEDTVSELYVGGTGGNTSSGDYKTKLYNGYYLTAVRNSLKQVKEGDLSKVIDSSGGDSGGQGNYLLRKYSSHVEDYESNFDRGTVASDKAIGVDNYGNVVNGEDGTVIVPYWHNHMFSGVKLNNHFFPLSPAITTYGTVYGDEMSTLLDVKGMASNKDIKEFIGKEGSLYNDAIKVADALRASGSNSFVKSRGMIENGYGTMSKDDTARALAVVIAASTQDAVQEWNRLMLEDADAGNELYISFEELKLDRSQQEMMEKRRWTAASLIQKIGWIMDYGMADTIRLTVISNLTRTYNSTIAQAGLEYIFYTEDITQSEGWQSISILISTILGAVVMVYLLWVGFQAYRGEVSWSKVLTKTLILAGILLYPMLFYGNMMTYMINKPTEWIMGNQMRLSVVLDTYFVEEGTNRNTNEFYENMFGKYADSDSLQLGSYNIVFYTTMDKAGFDINKTDPQDSKLSFVQSALLTEYQAGKVEYPKDKLVTVHVPLVDLYRWVWDVRYSGKGMDDETYGRGSPMPTYQEALDVMGEDGNDLFSWLAKGGSSYFAVNGYDEELASYEEYRVVTDKIKPDVNKDVMLEEDLSTYGATYQSHTKGMSREDDARHNAKSKEVDNSTGTTSISGSQLFYDIVYNSSTEASDDDINANLGALEDLSKLASLPEQEDSSKYIPSDDDLRSLIRDLSTTNRGRRYWYGDHKEWSNFSQAVMSGDSNGIIIDSNGVMRELVHKPELTPPKEDFLGLTHIVERYTEETRDQKSPYSRYSLEHDVSKINKNLLENYLSTYSITKMSLGDDGDRDQDALNHAERMVMSTEAYFQFNKAMGWRHFPSAYAVDSIKFDKYMALMYIPFRDYGKETMTFFDDSTVVPMSTAEYVAMKDSILAYFLFMVAIILLILFGMFYLAVLYVGLLVYSMVNFVKYYLIHHDLKNKSLLGSMYIIGTMSFAKVIVMGTVWLSSWIMNKQVATSSLNLPSYPTTIIHSLMMIGVLWLVFKHIIRPTWRGVMGDKDNMGGQFFSDRVQDVSSKIASGAFLPGRGKGVQGGSQASKFGKNSGRSNTKDRSNARRLGNLGKRGIQSARRTAGRITGVGSGHGVGKTLGTNTSRNIDKVKRALSAGIDNSQGVSREGRKNIDTSKIRAGNRIERMQLANLGDMLNGVAQTTSGLANTAIAGAKIGEELTNFKTGAMTTMALGSASAAAIVAQSLMDRGIQARADGEEVIFDSSGYDLEDRAVRSELFNNTVAELNEENQKYHANVMEGKVDGNTATQYSYNQGDERIDMLMDATKGIHPDTFMELTNSSEFKDLFIKPREEELSYDRNGGIIGLPAGGLKLKNPQMAVSDVQTKMDKLMSREAQIRESNDIYSRETKDRQAISIKDIDEGYYKENILPITRKVKGMSVQGSRIVYDKSNGEHQSAIREINNRVNTYNNEVESKYGKVGSNMIRYIASDGEDNGILTEHTTAEEDKGKAAVLYGGNYQQQNVRKYKVSDDNIGRVRSNIDAVNRLKEQSSHADKALGQVAKEYVSTKRDLRKALSEEVGGFTSGQRVGYMKDMVAYLEGTNVEHTPEFKQVRTNIHDIERSMKSNEISTDVYNDLMRRETKNLENVMDSTGKLDGFILDRYEDDPSHLRKYDGRGTSDREKGTLLERYNRHADKLDETVGRRNLMEMPLNIAESVVNGGEEYQLDGKGVIIQRSDARQQKTALDREDKGSAMSYLMDQSLNIQSYKERKLTNE